MEQGMSAAEWQVMRVVWAHPRSTSHFIVQALQGSMKWQPATIKTLLGRLRNKGYLEMKKEGTVYFYSPLISEEIHLKGQIQTILENICSTKHGELVQMILQAGHFATRDLENLQKALDTMKQQTPEKVICYCLPGQCTCGCRHSNREMSINQ